MTPIAQGPVDVTVGPELKPWRTQKWLTPELLHKAPSARFVAVDGNDGAQLEHPKGGPLTWVRCPVKNAVGVRKVGEKWHWLVTPNAELTGRAEGEGPR
jgi:hypothetical protein